MDKKWKDYFAEDAPTPLCVGWGEDVDDVIEDEASALRKNPSRDSAHLYQLIRKIASSSRKEGQREAVEGLVKKLEPIDPDFRFHWQDIMNKVEEYAQENGIALSPLIQEE